MFVFVPKDNWGQNWGQPKGKRNDMGLGIYRLSSAQVKAAVKAGRYSDGGGLYLNISRAGSKSWAFIWTQNKKRREMGLGPFREVSLQKAREKAENCRRQVRDGLDPIQERKKLDEPNFLDCALLLLEAKEKGWKHPKHKQQWRMTLMVYAKPLHPIKVSQITTQDVLAILAPIWMEKSETASRLRGRIEAVLDYAKAMGWRTGENPALWRGNLKSLLPELKRSKRVKHHPAMSFDELPEFMKLLKQREAMAARLLEFIILTASRSNEARGAKWDEIDFAQKTWTVPAERMKMGKEHVVPLSNRAVEIVSDLFGLRVNEYIFPNPSKLKPFSENGTRALLHRMKRPDVTTHGFRSTFRDWAGDCTHVQREVIEAALAHRIKDGVEAAYRRSTALEKRRKLMESWSDYCSSDPRAKIIQLKA